MVARTFISCWLFVVCGASTSLAQEPIRFSTSLSQSSEFLRAVHPPVEQMPLEAASGGTAFTAVDRPGRPGRLSELMRPQLALATEHHARTGGWGLALYEAQLKVPTYPLWGPPPPLLNAGFSFTDVRVPDTFDLPTRLYDWSLGLSWLRPINEFWTLRFALGAAHATDGKNNSSDAWQFRGGVFAMYRPSTKWTWMLGALALGRRDLPVVPAVGAIWQPSPARRLDLILPKPRLAFLLVDNGPRQQWGYVGAGFSGGTWAFERMGGVDDQLTYRDWRAVVGWESTPSPEPGMPFTRGRKLGAEVGYVFAREFTFAGEQPDIGLDPALMLRVTASF